MLQKGKLLVMYLSTSS